MAAVDARGRGGGERATLPTAFLILEDGVRVYRLLLNRAKMRIGGDEECHIQVRDPHLLPIHAEIRSEGAEFRLRTYCLDKTWINGEVPEDRRVLRNGDLITLGATQMRFVQPNPDGTSDHTLHLMIVPPGGIPFLYLTRKTDVHVGRLHGDLLVPDDLIDERHFIIENYCPKGVFVRPIDAQREIWMAGELFDGRRRLDPTLDLTAGRTTFRLRLDAGPGAALGAPFVRQAAAMPPDLAAGAARPPLVAAPGAGAPSPGAYNAVVDSLLRAGVQQAPPPRRFAENPILETLRGPEPGEFGRATPPPVEAVPRPLIDPHGPGDVGLRPPVPAVVPVRAAAAPGLPGITLDGSHTRPQALPAAGGFEAAPAPLTGALGPGDAAAPGYNPRYEPPPATYDRDAQGQGKKKSNTAVIEPLSRRRP